MQNKKTIEDINIKGKKVLVRCDFNVPMDKDGNITDDRRINSALPTIKHILENDGKVILMSHLGRPKGEVKKEFSLEAVAKRLADLLGREVIFAEDDEVVGKSAKKAVSEIKNGDVVLLQNTRFRKEEKKNDEGFAKDLSSLADIFVNDAFGTAHRAHASNVGVSKFLPTVMGNLVARELDVMEGAISNPKRPFLAILGGAKVSDKIGVIENLLDKVDSLIIGGGMAYTFLKAKGYEVGTSLLEEDKIDLAKDLMKKAKEKNVNLLLPVDTVVAKEFKNDTDYKTVDADSIPEDMMGVDIGDATIEL